MKPIHPTPTPMLTDHLAALFTRRDNEREAARQRDLAIYRRIILGHKTAGEADAAELLEVTERLGLSLNDLSADIDAAKQVDALQAQLDPIQARERDINESVEAARNRLIEAANKAAGRGITNEMAEARAVIDAADEALQSIYPRRRELETRIRNIKLNHRRVF